MKKIKQLSFFALALTFILSSCTMDKRVYTSGYHIEWKNGVRNSVKQKVASNKNEKKIVEVGAETNILDNTTEITEDNITASADNSVILPLAKPIYWKKEVKKSINKTTISPAPSNNKKKAKIISNDDGDNQTLSIIGMVLGILGCVGYYAGPLFGLAAIIVSAIALNKIKKDPKTYGGRTMALVGLILGIVSVVVWTIVIAVVIAALAMV